MLGPTRVKWTRLSGSEDKKVGEKNGWQASSVMQISRTVGDRSSNILCPLWSQFPQSSGQGKQAGSQEFLCTGQAGCPFHLPTTGVSILSCPSLMLLRSSLMACLSPRACSQPVSLPSSPRTLCKLQPTGDIGAKDPLPPVSSGPTSKEWITEAEVLCAQQGRGTATFGKKAFLESYRSSWPLSRRLLGSARSRALILSRGEVMK